MRTDRLEQKLEECEARTHTRPLTSSSSLGPGGPGESEEGVTSGCGQSSEDQQDRGSTTSSAGADTGSGGGVVKDDKSSVDEVRNRGKK